MPSDMIKTTIGPVIRINVVDSNNYRPIAIATIVSKLYESTILYKCEVFLNTCDNQFGFKHKHSTEFCIYTKGINRLLYTTWHYHFWYIPRC